MNIFSNLGITELIVILLLALLVVGPERLPEMGRRLAKILKDVRTAYENLTRDLGPELMSIQETTRELRDSVESVRSIPKDVVGSVVKAADLEDTIKDLKEVQQTLEQTGQSVTQAGNMIKAPLDEVVTTAQNAFKAAEAAGKPGNQMPAKESPAAEPANQVPAIGGASAKPVDDLVVAEAPAEPDVPAQDTGAEPPGETEAGGEVEAEDHD